MIVMIVMMMNAGGIADSGAMTSNGIIYCPPYMFLRGILKIDTNTDTATELNLNVVPERYDFIHGGEISSVAALNGCIYFMWDCAGRIMKLDPNNGDAISSVGDYLGDDNVSCNGMVIGIDGCIYVMPTNGRILKHDPINDITSFLGQDTHGNCGFNGNGVVGRDGCIYGLANNGQVLKIDTRTINGNNSHCFVGNKFRAFVRWFRWGDAILGIDGCIYWPPKFFAERTLKYDPHLNQTSLVGDNFEYQWSDGVLATDGVIYCIPNNANQVLSIDPIGEFLATTKANIQEHPEEFGSLFQTVPIEAERDSTILSLTNFDVAVVKFGRNKVFQVLEKAMEPMNPYCNEYLWPFLIAASYKDNNPACAINHLLHRNFSWVNSSISSLKGNTPKNKKIRIK